MVLLWRSSLGGASTARFPSSVENAGMSLLNLMQQARRRYRIAGIRHHPCAGEETAQSAVSVVRRRNLRRRRKNVRTAPAEFVLADHSIVRALLPRATGGLPSPGRTEVASTAPPDTSALGMRLPRPPNAAGLLPEDYRNSFSRGVSWPCQAYGDRGLELPAPGWVSHSLNFDDRHDAMGAGARCTPKKTKRATDRSGPSPRGTARHGRSRCRKLANWN